MSQQRRAIVGEGAGWEKIKSPSFYSWDNGKLQLKAAVEKVIRTRLKGGLVPKDKTDTLKVDTIIPAELTLEIDGMGGMVPGDVIQTDYIQAQYNSNIKIKNTSYGPFTYFQVFGLSQKVDATSWTTELTTKMRINHIPYHQDMKTVKDEEPEEEDKKIVSIVKIKPPPKKTIPEMKIRLPDETSFDKIDYENYEKVSIKISPSVEKILEEPGVTNIANKTRPFAIPTPAEFRASENLRKNIMAGSGYTHTFPKISQDAIAFTSTIQEGSTYNNLQLGEQGFKLNIEAYEQDPKRPRIPVPTDDEDIADDVVLDELTYETFTEWLLPVLTQKKTEEEIVSNNIEQTENLNLKKIKKAPVFVKRESTYEGRYWQNDKYLYVSPHHPEWRPIFQFQDGSRRSFDTISSTGERAVKIIREARPYSERKSYWNDNIESPKPEGKSLLSKRGGSSTERDFYGPSTPY